MAWDLVGHKQPLALLAGAVQTSSLAQSLLFTGPAGVGKRTLALALAAAVNCSGPGSRCGECRACRLSEAGDYPDLHVIELRDGRQRIGIKDIQEIQGTLARRPIEGRRQVVVVADAERLSSEAENCLLKTLEEPPAGALVILTTVDAGSLLPTTVSRCRQLRLRPASDLQIATHLREHFSIAADRASLLAGLAAGRPGWAIQAARNEGLLDAHEAALERLGRAAAGSRLDRLELSRTLAEGWSRSAERVRDELATWARWWRDLLLVSLGLEDRVAHRDRLPLLRQECSRFDRHELRKAIATLVQAQADLDQNVNPRLALDLALLHLPTPRQAA